MVAASKTNVVDRVLRFARQTSRPDPIVAAFAHSSRLIGEVRSVFEVGKTFKGPNFDSELLACLCLEGLSPISQAPLKASRHPAIRCLALVKGDSVRGSNAGKDLSSLFGGNEGPNDHYQTDIRAIVYTNFMSALAAGLAGKPTSGWAKIPDHASKSWLANAVRAFERLARRISEHWINTKNWPSLGDIFNWYDGKRCYVRGYDAQRRFNAIRLALIDAAFDLCLIGRGIDAAYCIDNTALSEARISVFWLDELWLDKLTARRISLHDDASATMFISTYMNKLASTVSQFNERTTTFGKLALVAYDHNKSELATQALKRSVDCLLGYGWRKDIFADEVLSSLEMMIEAGDAEAKLTLLELAGAFHNITKYTDGSGTSHIRGYYYASIAKYYPERIAPMLNDLIKAEEWRYAEDLYKDLTLLPLAKTVEGSVLLSTYIMPSEKHAVEVANLAPAVSDTLSRKIGTNIKHAQKVDHYTDESHNDLEKNSTESPKSSDYPPGKLSALIAERSRLKIYDRSRSAIGEWLSEWDAHRQGAAALADLEMRLSDTRHSFDVERALDDAAQLAAKIHGRSEAFKWLVRAQIARYGWQRHLTSDEETEARLSLVARDYKARWKEFIKETSKPALDLKENSNDLVIGFSRLVYLLIRLGEFERAKAHTKALVDVFKAELAQQPLDKPSWA